MGSSIKIYTLLVFVSLFAFSCEKEITAPDNSADPNGLTVEQQTDNAQQYARVQNYMNDFLTNAFSGAIAEPSFYGMNMASTQTSCPSTELSANGDVLTMQFGSGPTVDEACTMLNSTRVGGTLALNKNFCPNIYNTRGCQPGALEFDELYVQGCSVEALRSNGNEHLHPNFYSWENCPNLNDYPGTDPDEIVNFWFTASSNWKMKLTDPNGKATIFNPINSYDGAFMRVKAPNIFVEDLNFEDLYNASYQISLLRQGSHDFNKINFKGAGENGEDVRMLVMTTEDLVYTPYQCKSIISGQVLLMDLDCTPLMCIDYGAGAEEADAGECDNIVRICPCDEWGEAITDSPDCIVTSCLPHFFFNENRIFF